MSEAAKRLNKNEEKSSKLKLVNPDAGLMEALQRSQAVVEFSVDGCVENANTNFLNLMGYGPDEVVGKHHSFFCDSEYANSQDYKAFWSKLARGEYETGEYKYTGKNGREVWVAASFNPICEKSGKVLKIVAVATDITNSKVELKVRTEIMNMTSIVSEADLKGDIVTVNEKFIQVSKYAKDELIGKGHNTTRHPDMPKEVFKQMWATIGKGNIFRGVVKNRAKDGTPYYVDAVIAPILGPNGKPKKYLGVRYDITEAEIERHNARGVLSAIDSAYAYIEFDLEGCVINANKNFLDTLGYQISEIKGKHHRLFCESQFANSHNYTQFWAELKVGKIQNDVFKRVTKSGKEIWIQAIYAPVKDEMGRIFKFVKIATEITAEKNKAIEIAAKMDAISKAQAVIEFNLDGTIISANENFLKTLNYDLADIKGKHHRMFCEPEYAGSTQYRHFWEKLNNGEFEAGEYKRVGRGGKVVWINASYNPILDANGKAYKVVKYATDITAVKNMIQQIEETAKVLSSSSMELTANATQMASVSSKMNKETLVASSAAEEIASGIQTVATNTEEMVASIKEIARSTMESSEMAKTTMQRAQETNKTITQLGVSSQEIGDVIKVISSIAQQTNLLALNATIEAARAGEAGRGFAVVANEVKELAKQTAKATHEITNKIGAIQKDTLGAVDAIAGISAAVEKLNSISGVIAAAVEEQTSTSSEVSRVVLESKKGVESIAETIRTVSQASNESSVASDTTLNASKDLAKLSEKLANLVSKSH